MRTKNDLVIRVAGEGGEGIISSGDFIAAACARAGLEVYTFKTFPAEIKGGYAMYQIRSSTDRIYNQGDTFEVFCAFNGAAFKKIMVPEVNFQEQISFFLRAETSIRSIPYTICGGLPFTPAMIIDRAKEILS